MIDCRLMIAALLCALLGLAACSGGTDQASLPQQDGAEAALQLDGLELLDGSLLDAAASRGISVEWSEEEGRTQARIHAEDVRDLRALYFSLEHAAGLQATAIEAGDWASAGSLELALTPESGHSEAGIVLIDPDNTQGFNGSGLLATVQFGDEAGQQRSLSDAPGSLAARTKLYYAPDFFFYYWYYMNPGDYDQNGEVNISDLTPLAIHFGKSSPGGFDLTRVESVVDGDGNGEINIADVSPIGANFGNSVTDYELYFGSQADYPAEPGDPTGGVAVQSWMFSEATGNASQQRLLFQKTVQIPLPITNGAWLHPLSGSSVGISSTVVGFGNQSPDAQLVLDSITGIAPFSVMADGSASTDPDGDPLSFQWILGDELSLLSSGGLFDPADMGDSFSADIDTQGNYKVAMLVRDPQGALDFAVQDVLAADAAGWRMLDIDMQDRHTNFKQMQDVDICEVGGLPCIGYSFETVGGVSGSQVYMMQPASLFDDDWDSTNIAYGESNVQFTEVAVCEVAGTAAVAATMDRSSNGHAFFARQIEAGEPELFNTHFFESPNDVLSGIDMVVAKGQPIVMYRNNDTGEARLAVSIDTTAQNWVGPVSVAVTGAPSTQISMAVVDDAPAFSYWAGASSNRLRYHTSSMPAQLPVFNSGTTLRVLTSGYVSDALVVRSDGRPAVFYSIPADTAIHGFSADDVATSSWTDLGEVSEANATVTEYCAGLHGGRPALMWYDVLTAELYYQRATDGDGTGWGSAELVDDSLAIGTRPTMATVQGVPVIAYVDRGRNVVRYGVYVE